MEEDEKFEESSNKETAKPEEINSQTDEQPKAEPAKDSGDGLTEQQQKKVIYSLSYLFGILFFLPLILYPKDETARFHSNQSLVILLIAIVGEVVFGLLTMIPYAGIVFSILCGVLGLVLLIACIYCIVCIVTDKDCTLPLIGKIRIIK